MVRSCRIVYLFATRVLPEYTAAETRSFNSFLFQISPLSPKPVLIHNPEIKRSATRPVCIFAPYLAFPDGTFLDPAFSILILAETKQTSYLVPVRAFMRNYAAARIFHFRRRNRSRFGVVRSVHRCELMQVLNARNSSISAGTGIPPTSSIMSPPRVNSSSSIWIST